MIGVPEEDQSEHRHGVFGRLEPGVGAELVGCVPEALLDLGMVCGHWRDLRLN